jgi:hypothetical protein
MKLYLTYKDDGSNCAGGQDESTFARNKLYILDGEYDQIKNKIEELESQLPHIRRKNPRFGDVYIEGSDDNYNDVVYFDLKNV